MEKKRTLVIFAAAVILVVAITGWILLRNQVGPYGKTVYTVEDFPNASQSIGDSAVIEERVAILNDLYSQLGTKDQADDSYHWLRIGTIKKTLQDYSGAEAAWLRSAELNQSSAIFGNLAQLYGFELDQPEKALEYYLQALSINPTSASYYQDIANLYRYKLGNDLSRIESIMQLAVENNPEQANYYYVYLVEYFDDEGDKTKLDEYLDKILNNSPDEQTLEYLRSGGYLTS